MEMKKMELETEIKQMEAKGDDILILGIESSCDETCLLYTSDAADD